MAIDATVLHSQGSGAFALGPVRCARRLAQLRNELITLENVTFHLLRTQKSTKLKSCSSSALAQNNIEQFAF